MFLQAIEANLPDNWLEGDLKYIIKKIWDHNLFRIILPFVMIEWAGMITFMIHIVWANKNRPLAITSISLALFGLVTDIMEAVRDIKYYRVQPNNYLDLIQFSSIPILSYMACFTDCLDRSNQWYNLFINFIILISGFRGLSGLRLNNKMRYLIAMILQVFIDLAGFIVISFFCIVIFSVIGVNHLSLTQVEEDFEGWNTLRTQMDAYFNVLFGNWAEANNFETNRFSVYIFSAVFIGLILANLVIGMISHTFEVFQETKELVDTKQILDLLLEHAHLLSYFRGRGITQKDELGMVNFCIIKRKDIDKEDIQDQLDRIDQKVDYIKTEVGTEIKTAFEKMDEMKLELTHEFQNSFEKVLKILEEKNKMKPEIEKILEEKLLDLEKKLANSIKNRISKKVKPTLQNEVKTESRRKENIEEEEEKVEEAEGINQSKLGLGDSLRFSEI